MSDTRLFEPTLFQTTLFEATITGSLPKPSWLAEPEKLWAGWRLQGDALDEGKRDATILAVKLQEDCGIDLVTDGEQARQHFVHGFLERVDGIDFTNKVEMGIRNDRYKAMVPVVIAPLRLKDRVHALEAKAARVHTMRKLKFTLPGPMTVADTIADRHYGDRVEMAFAYADCLNAEVAATIEAAMRYVPKNRIVACTNCGVAPMSRTLAEAKLKALGDGARLARERFA